MAQEVLYLTWIRATQRRSHVSSQNEWHSSDRFNGTVRDFEAALTHEANRLVETGIHQIEVSQREPCGGGGGGSGGGGAGWSPILAQPMYESYSLGRYARRIMGEVEER